MRIGFKPPRPSGSDRQALFLQWVWDRLTQLKFNNSSTVSWDMRTSGVTANAAPASAVAASGVTIKALHFKQSFGDYFLTTEGTSVAKGYKLRNSITKETIYGTVVNFAYPHNVAGDSLAYIYRAATVTGAGSESQGVVPQYLYNDLIYAVQIQTGVLSSPDDTSQPTGTAIGWLDLNCDGRAWTRFSNPAF